MLDEQLKTLGIESKKLDPIAQKECEDIICRLSLRGLANENTNSSTTHSSG